MKFLIALLLSSVPATEVTMTYVLHFLFLANVPPAVFMPLTSHLWSLCVEMQFYLGVAFLVAAGGKRSLWILPLLAVAVTMLRIHTGVLISIFTVERSDEILVGDHPNLDPQ